MCVFVAELLTPSHPTRPYIHDVFVTRASSPAKLSPTVFVSSAYVLVQRR
jgi:hypothetical protein